MYDDFFKQWSSGRGKVTQGSINCAKKSLQLQSEGFIPYWMYSENTKLAQDSLVVSSPGLVTCGFENYFLESVDHSEKPIKLLEVLAKKIESTIAFSEFNVVLRDQILAGIVDANELNEILKFLLASRMLSFYENKSIGMPADTFVYDIPIKITVNGWHALRQRNSFPNSNKVFVATQFQWDGEDELRKQSMLAIKNACKDLGYEADIVKQDHTGNITDKIISEIKSARFVIADLTFNNRGVYYEAGYARALGRHVFHVIHEDHIADLKDERRRVHFDIQQIMFRKWKTPTELQSELRNWIEATVGRYGETNRG